jgi:hypothetical protein
MAPNVFMSARQLARRTHPRRRVGTAGELADRLNITKMLQRAIEIRQIEGLGKRQRLHRLANIVELLNAAYAAAGAPGQRATALFQPHKTAAGEFNLHFQAVAGLHHVHAVDLAPVLNNPFG